MQNKNMQPYRYTINASSQMLATMHITCWLVNVAPHCKYNTRSMQTQCIQRLYVIHYSSTTYRVVFITPQKSRVYMNNWVSIKPLLPPDHLTIWPPDHLTAWPPDHLTTWPPDHLTTWPPEPPGPHLDHPDHLDNLYHLDHLEKWKVKVVSA